MHRAGAALTGLVGVAAWAIGLAFAGFALAFPLELETREGTNWFLGLAHSAGQDLYAHDEVAFVNMNHGPLDPMVKGLVHTLMPWEPGHVANRVFVLALPFALLFAAWAVLRRPLDALLASGVAYLALLAIDTNVLLVGRSDPTAMTFLALQFACIAFSWRGGRRRAVADALVGVLAAATILTSWRFAPVSLAAGLIWLLPPTGWPGLAETGRRLAVAAGAGLALAAAVFVLELHSSLTLVRQHFFDFFDNSKGHGAKQIDTLSAAFTDLFTTRTRLVVLLLLVPAALGLRALRSRSITAAWPPIALLAFLVVGYGFYLNRSGGGLIYYAPALALLWFAGLAMLAPHVATATPLRRLVALAVVVVWVPWIYLEGDARRLQREIAPAQQFVDTYERVTKGAYVYTEGLHLQKTHYSGEKVDMGDTAEEIMSKGTFGPDTTRVTRQAFAALETSPPRFILAGAVDREALERLLRDRYELVAKAPVEVGDELWRLR